MVVCYLELPLMKLSTFGHASRSPLRSAAFWSAPTAEKSNEGRYGTNYQLRLRHRGPGDLWRQRAVDRGVCDRCAAELQLEMERDRGGVGPPELAAGAVNGSHAVDGTHRVDSDMGAGGRPGPRDVHHTVSGSERRDALPVAPSGVRRAHGEINVAAGRQTPDRDGNVLIEGGLCRSHRQGGMPDGRDEAVGSANGPVTCPDGADKEDVAASELDRAADEWDTVIPAGAVVHPTSGINATRPTATISRCDLLAVTTDPASSPWGR